ncbi:hypothetical protein ACZ90_56165 [Streptomyces albus subsp. albus]|nr:hypothetical protein ACZ90_56165 [Streptomyces albus subsp. albus]
MRRPPRPAAPGSFPPPGNLPAAVDRFIGRAAETVALERRLCRARLVTVTGMGGVGKTRLALRVAEGLQDRFCAGVWLVELARLGAGADPGRAAVESLGLTGGRGQSPLSVLAGHFAAGEALLVLDGAEHLADRCAPLVAALLRRAPGLRALVTSRRPLETAGEHCFPLAPMRVEPDAVALFGERAAAVLPGFDGAHPARRTAVAELCRRLDGVPLALELAVGRLRALSVEQLLERLDHLPQLSLGADPPAPPPPAGPEGWAGDRVEAGGPDCGPLPRHRTLRTAIGWSHELCTPRERLLWSRLSVFDADFDLEAVEYVCVDAALPGEEVLTVLTGLVAQSVVVREETAGRVRYRMLGTVREYGAAWLAELGELGEPGESERLRRRHRDWYLGLATWCELDWFGPRQAEVAQRIDRELPNLRLALEYSLQTPGEAHVGQYLSGVLWFYWLGCGRLAEGRGWLDRALALEGEQPEARARALWVAGLAAVARGEAVAAFEVLTECGELARGCGDEAAAVHTTQALGAAAVIGGDLPRGLALLRETVDRFRARGELSTLVLLAQVQLAQALAFEGRADAARELCEEVRDTAAQSGERWVRSYALYVLGYLGWAAGDRAGARLLLRECLGLKHELHDEVGMALALELLAALVVDEAPRWAARLQGAAEAGWRGFGTRAFGSRHFDAPHRGCARRARAALGEAVYQEALRRGRRGGVATAVAQVLALAGGDANGPRAVRRSGSGGSRAVCGEVYVPPGQRA